MMENNFSLELAGIPKELQLLIHILKTENDDSASIFSNEQYSNIDWKFFIVLAKHHRIYPQIFSKVNKIDSPYIPENVIQMLSQLYKRNTFQMLRMSGEMELTSKLFSDKGIRLLFLKGPVLAEDLYGDISLRTSSDLDVLIPIEKLDKVDTLLTDEGYEKDDYIQTVLNDWKWRHHHVTYLHPQKQIKLEVHWRLNPGPGLEPSFEDLWECRRKSTITDSPVYLLGKEDLFLFLVSHGARHGWSRLRWLMDIHQLVNKQLNWKKLIGHLRKYQSLSLGGQALLLSSQLFDTQINKDISHLMTGKQPKQLAQATVFYLENRVNLHTEPLPKEVSKYHGRYLFSLKTIQQKFLFIMSFLYPYPEDAEILPLPKILHFLYFPLRPVLWVWRKTKKQAVL
jgi:hypothetical protein